MMGDPFDEIRRQQERINELLGPSYRIQEEILRSYAPIRELTESLRSVTDSLVVNGITEDVFRSIAKIGRLDLADFDSVGALTAASRDIAAATEASWRTSQVTAAAPSSVASDTAASYCTSPITTWAPRAVSARAVAAPMPEAPPVMNAMRPAKSLFIADRW